MEDLTFNEKVLLGTTVENVKLLDDSDELSAVKQKLNQVQKNLQQNGQLNHFAMMNESGASKYRRQVIDRLGLLPKELQQKLINGSAQISDVVLYSKQLMSEVVNGELIPTAKSKQTGLRNITNGKYDYNFILFAAQLLYDSSEVNGKYETDLPKEIVNSDLIILTEGKPVISNLPVLSFTTVGGFPATKKFNFVEFENPKLFKEKTDIQVKLEKPTAFTTGAIAILLYGCEIRTY